MDEPLSAEDYASVRLASQLLHENGWRAVFTPNQMTESWAALIEEVAEGYDWCMYEYLNDVSCRRWLALAWPHWSERVRAARKEELDRLDQRFRDVTIDCGDSIPWGSDDPQEWWLRRCPKVLVGELADDLRPWAIRVGVPVLFPDQQA